MCGISGEFRFDDRIVDSSFIQRINRAQHQRGPDAEGIFLQKNVALGHRRLMIMDLSPQSQQPMYDPNLGLALVFNGAVYNYREIRADLEDKGYDFFSDGDTEVILKAFHFWGADCLQRFNGMFAFAIWIRDENKLFIARDRLGIKPFYYTLNSRFIRFASSLPALLHSGGDIDSALDPLALHYYLHFHAVVPAPQTLFRSIQKLEPGHYAWINTNGEFKKHLWWQLNYPRQNDDNSVEAWKEQLLEQLSAAVRRRNVAAVDVGVLLSGGVDSSLLVGLLAEVKSAPVKTFSIGFEHAGGESGDEFQYSDIIAERYATEHTKIRVSERELLDNLPRTIAAMSEPMISHDCIGFYLLSQTVTQHCRVVQSGQGADEVFGGYHWYPPLLDTQTPVDTYRQVFFDRNYDEYENTVAPQWRTPDYATRFVTEMFARPGASHAVDQALRLDTTVMLVEDPVKRVDNMTMAASLEARVPFLDHELVEFAARIPHSLKIKQGGKWILKETARQLIPNEVIDRPKGYFPVPMLKYLSGEVLATVKSSLHSAQCRQRGLFNPAYIDQLLQAPHDHITSLGSSKLWQLGLLELWLQTHEI